MQDYMQDYAAVHTRPGLSAAMDVAMKPPIEFPAITTGRPTTCNACTCQMREDMSDVTDAGALGPVARPLSPDLAHHMTYTHSYTHANVLESACM